MHNVYTYLCVRVTVSVRVAVYVAVYLACARVSLSQEMAVECVWLHMHPPQDHRILLSNVATCVAGSRCARCVFCFDSFSFDSVTIIYNVQTCRLTGTLAERWQIDSTRIHAGPNWHGLSSKRFLWLPGSSSTRLAFLRPIRRSRLFKHEELHTQRVDPLVTAFEPRTLENPDPRRRWTLFERNTVQVEASRKRVAEIRLAANALLLAQGWGLLDRRGATSKRSTEVSGRDLYVMYSGLKSPGFPLQTPGEAGTHGTATSSIMLLGRRWNGENLDLFGVFGLFDGDSANVTLRRGLRGGGGGGGRANSGGGGGVGREMAGDSWLSKLSPR